MRLSPGRRSWDGFTLVELLVAMLILVVVSVGVVRLFAMSLAASRVAHDRTLMAVLAAGKLEQLRSLEWAYDIRAAGPPVVRSDTSTDLSVDSTAAGGPGLADSASGTLDANTPSYVDYLDKRGRWIGTGSSPQPSAVYIRRWSVRRLPADPERLIALTVLVTTVARERLRVGGIARTWTGEDAIVTTVVARKAR
jgi:prepilin-type N-terminal cleavage/methylation domain-containing protein